MHPLDIHIEPLDRPPVEVAAFEATLAPDELARAARGRDPLQRARFVVGRGLLRSLLGAALGQAPAAVRLRYNPHGKPNLAEEPAGGLRFSLAHSQNMALYALASGCGEAQLGVDLEAIAALNDMGALVQRFFSARERDAWLALPERLRTRGFYACWTRKEAVLKALGVGLARPLGSFDVSVDPDAPARLLAIDGDEEAARPWLLRDLPMPDGFAAALAIHPAPLPSGRALER
jgi:4'-phosphopantetheinyl transferase